MPVKHRPRSPLFYPLWQPQSFPSSLQTCSHPSKILTIKCLHIHVIIRTPCSLQKIFQRVLNACNAVRTANPVKFVVRIATPYPIPIRTASVKIFSTASCKQTKCGNSPVTPRNRSVFLPDPSPPALSPLSPSYPRNLPI